jgi:hypothetical protein
VRRDPGLVENDLGLHFIHDAHSRANTPRSVRPFLVLDGAGGAARHPPRGSQEFGSRSFASSEVLVASTSCAAARHCSRVTVASWTPTAGIAVGAIESEVTPRPRRTQASSGSAAASPHTPTGLPARSPAAAVIAMRRRTAGCHGSVRVARGEDIRSAASVYWVRSFVPIEKKSTSAMKASARMATAGTSTMMPGEMPLSRARAEKSRASSTVETIGAITHGLSTWARRAPSASASSWRASSPSLVRSRRMPRTPRAGFSSFWWFANGTGLSDPASRVRTTTLPPGNAPKTSA